MSYKVRLTSKGQMTIPKDLRDALRLKAGTSLQASILDGKLVLEPIYSQDGHEAVMEYAAKYTTDKKTGLQELRKRTAGLSVEMDGYIRKTRDEEGNGQK